MLDYLYLGLALLTGVGGVVKLLRYDDFADDFFGDDDPMMWLTGTVIVILIFIMAAWLAPLLWLAAVGRLIYKRMEKRNA